MSASTSDPIVQESMRALQGMFGSAPTVTSEKPLINGEAGVSMMSAPSGVVETQKAFGYFGTDDLPVGSALNPEAQLGLFTQIRGRAGWSKYVSYCPTDERQGNLDLFTVDGFKMKPTAHEGPRTGIPVTKPSTSRTQFECKTASGAMGFHLHSIKAARKAGVNINDVVRDAVAKGCADLFMDLGINGDTTLPADTPDNTFRRMADGWWKKLTAGASYTASATGFAYHNQVWPGMIQEIDEAYRVDPGLAWGIPDVINTKWLGELSGINPGTAPQGPSVINATGVSVLLGGQPAAPMARPAVIIPQISSQGWGSEGYSGKAPTSVTNNGDGTLTININTLAGTTNRGSTGPGGQRYVIVGSLVTGETELLAVSYSSPNNTVTTSSVLGQTSVSTTASAYFVKWADMTRMMLGVFRYMTLVVQNGIRVYSVFYPRDEKFEVIVHADVDFIVVDDKAFSLVDGIIAPRYNIIP